MKHPRATGLGAAANDAGEPLAPFSHGERRTSLRWHMLMGAIVLIYLVFAGVHAVRTPTGATGYQDAPDEAAHLTVVRVVSTGRMPTRAAPALSGHESAPSYEWHQPPLYYLLAARFLALGEKGVRTVSILIGLACILTIYRAVRVLFPEWPEVATIAAGIAALIPGHGAITSVVNNDGLLELGFSGYLLLWFTSLVAGLTLKRSIFLGAVLGAALLTKLTAILLIPFTALALLLLYRNGESKSAVWRSLLVIATVAMLVSGWWFIRNGLIYHEWLPLSAFRQSFEGTVKSSDIISGTAGLRVDGWPGYACLVALWTFQSFFAVYSTARGAQWGVPSFLPIQLSVLAGVSAIASVAGPLLLSRTGKMVISRSQTHGLWMLAALLGLVGASFAVFTSRYFQAQGRYFYPAMLPITLLWALGWRSLFPPRYANIAGIILLVYLGASCLAFQRTLG